MTMEVSSGNLETFRSEVAAEFHAIARWWLTHVVDPKLGNIVAEVSNDNSPNRNVGKSLVLITRLVWFYSAAYREEPRTEYRATAVLCYQCLLKNFRDTVYGGMIWKLDREDRPESQKKQSYGQAFAIYALSEFYLAFGDDEALSLAQDLVNVLENYMHDGMHGGYLEGLSRSFSPLADRRLGDKDLNAEKTMNTHLHILEAYTNFYRAKPSKAFFETLAELVTLFVDKFIRPKGAHLTRFYSRDWREVHSGISFGHDIEASWLVWETVNQLGDPALIEQYRQPVIELADGVLARGIDEYGAVANEMLPGSFRDETRIWWVQAEAMVGFMNAWQMTGQLHYLDASRNCWSFIQRYHLDRKNGEWLWFSHIDKIEESNYKSGEWKAPYHNGRAVLEMLHRLTAVANRVAKEHEAPLASTSASSSS